MPPKRVFVYAAIALLACLWAANTDDTTAISVAPSTCIVLAIVLLCAWLSTVLALGSVATVVSCMRIVSTLCGDAAILSLVTAIGIVLYMGDNPLEVLRAVLDHASRGVDTIVWIRDILMAVGAHR